MIWFFLFSILLFCFLLSGIESSILCVSRIRLRHHSKKNNQRAVRLEKLFQKREQLLSSILILKNTLVIGALAIATKNLVDAFDRSGYLLSFLIALPIYLLLIELLPKSAFKRFPFRTLHTLSYFIEFIYFLVFPIIKLGILPFKLFFEKKEQDTEADTTAREAFKNITNISEREGTIGKTESKMIRNIIDFKKLHAHDLMIPLSKITAIPIEMPISSAINLSKETNYDQFPVLSPKGNLVGVIDMYEIIKSGKKEGKVVQFLRRLARAQTTDSGKQIIQKLRQYGTNMAQIYDKDNNPLGVVIAEELIHTMLYGERSPSF